MHWAEAKGKRGHSHFRASAASLGPSTPGASRLAAQRARGPQPGPRGGRTTDEWAMKGPTSALYWLWDFGQGI